MIHKVIGIRQTNKQLRGKMFHTLYIPTRTSSLIKAWCFSTLGTISSGILILPLTELLWARSADSALSCITMRGYPVKPPIPMRKLKEVLGRKGGVINSEYLADRAYSGSTKYRKENNHHSRNHNKTLATKEHNHLTLPISITSRRQCEEIYFQKHGFSNTIHKTMDPISIERIKLNWQQTFHLLLPMIQGCYHCPINTMLISTPKRND